MSRQLRLSEGNIHDVSIVDRMEQAFLDYSMSVIVGRALPDVRDGLKPVQRRILYSMWESGLVPTRNHRKCASAVGEVMKLYHPHGDSSIYDALVRMAQDFSMREPLVDGHGNFGSIDGDPAAAMRYTEARLSALAMELLAGIDEDTVDFAPNYDGYDEEPTVLPARFPNLLVNGASGIAVGMATNIAPHNLGEVIDACLLLIKRPDADLAQLMEIVPAPDFPTGARIIVGDGIRDAYANGRGAITVEAVATTEMRTGNLPRIVVTEIPYQVNKTTLLQRIADLIEKRRLNAIRDLRDESSRDGMRIVIELKRGEDPAVVLADLYKSTDLRTNINVNAVALVDGAPQTLGLRDMLGHYLAHQREVVTRRTQHRLDNARERAHVVEGLLTALDNLDEVIALIRASRSAADAREGLMQRFDLSERQAKAVLDMMLRRLAALERAELEEEYQQLQATIADLEAILGDPEVLDRVLVEELRAIRNAHATPRRSVLVQPGITTEQVLEGGSAAGFVAQDVTVMVTRKGYLKPLATRRVTPSHKHVSDPLAAVIRCDTDTTLLLFDAEGTCWRVGVGDVPVAKANQRGTYLGQLLGAGPDSDVVGAVPLIDGPDAHVLLATRSGQVKRVAMEELITSKRSISAINLKGDDQLAAVATCGADGTVLLAHDGGQVTRFAVDDVRAMGRGAGGVAGMKVPAGSAVIALSVLDEHQAQDATVITVGADGTAKRAPLDDYPVKGRGGKGLLAGAAPLAWCGVGGDVHVHADPPFVVRVVDLPETKRSASGAPMEQAPTGPVVAETTAPLPGQDADTTSS